MTKLPNAVVGDAYTSSFHWDILEDIVDVGNRMAGQEGERRGAERVRDAFEEIGLRNVHLDEFEIDGWWRGDSTPRSSGVHEGTFDADYQVTAHVDAHDISEGANDNGAGTVLDVRVERPRVGAHARRHAG